MFRSNKLLTGIGILLAAALWAVLVFHDSQFFRKTEDLSLFLFDRLFVLEAFKTPGGVLGLAGSFLTQFLHYPWLGALIWVVLLALSVRLSAKAFDIPDNALILSCIPAVLLIIGNMSLGYGVFIMRAQDHFFSPTLGYLLSLVPVLAVRRFSPRPMVSAVILTLWTAALYPLAGAFALAGALSAGLYLAVNKKGVLPIIASAAAILLIPLLFSRFYTTFRLADAWLLGVPDISYAEWATPVRMPYYILLLFTVAAPITVCLKSGISKNNGYAVQAAAAVAMIVIVGAFWYRDPNFRTELAMSLQVDEFNWKETVRIFEKAVQSQARSDAKAYKSRTARIKKARSDNEIMDIVDSYESRFFQPTRTMVLYRDLALLKQDKALDLAFTMKDGGRLQKSRTQISMAMQSGKQFYLQYGAENMCYRWCMEDIVECGWRFSTLRYMAMYAIVTHEENLALKYLDKLSKTLFYRKWAESQRELLADRNRMENTEPYKSIIPYLSKGSIMSNDMAKTEVFLINHFTAERPKDATPQYDRAALLFAMRSQDIPSFWNQMLYYVNSNDFDRLPRPVQEAAILYSNLEKKGIQLPYDQAVRESYDSFNKFVSSHPLRSLKESDYIYSQKFGKTFFYYYYFTRNLQTY